ncbi:MAG: DUF2868 domain-containing protein [Gammaproteobacteria bacterium]
MGGHRHRGCGVRTGAAVDHFASNQQVNILAPPVLGLLVWNLVVYVSLAIRAVMRMRRSVGIGPARRTVVWMGAAAGLFRRPSKSGNAIRREVLTRFARDWTALTAPLYAARAVRILHLAAAAVAIGVIAGLYMRGIAFEYRATWQSTFLGAETVRSIVAIGYAPGLWLMRMPVPDVSEIASLQLPPGENAAPWLHLMAATLLLVVVAPRLVLAVVAGVKEYFKASNLSVVITQPYFQRVLRGFHTGRARVEVLPYSVDLSTDGIANLEDLLARVLGGNVELTSLPAAQYGDEAPAADSWEPDDTDPLVVLHDLTVTPEQDVHGSFLATLAQNALSRRLMVFVDESSFSARIGAPERLARRRQLWTEFCAEYNMTPLFINLESPDLVAAEEKLDGILTATESRP